MTIQSLTDVGLWIYDLSRPGMLTPLPGGGEVLAPVWAPDGKRPTFEWTKDGRTSLAVQPADGTAVPQVLVPDNKEHSFNPSSWTPNGRELAFVPFGDIRIVTVETGQVQPLLPPPTPGVCLWLMSAALLPTRV